MSVAKHLDTKSINSPLPLEELQWVRKVRENGDRGAFEKIFRANYKKLYLFACGFVGHQLADDVVQSVFLKIWDKRKSWKPPGTVKQYLFAAIRNEALNILRRQRVESDAKDTVTHMFRDLKKQSYQTEGPETNRLRSAIQNGIESLPPKCREIFILSRMNGLSYTEISDVLNISVATVGTQMGRALEKLEVHLSEWRSLLILFVLTSVQGFL